MDAWSTGLALLIGCLVTFMVVLPRGGRVSPLLRRDAAQSAFMMVWVAVFILGWALVLFGYPLGVLSMAQ